MVSVLSRLIVGAREKRHSQADLPMCPLAWPSFSGHCAGSVDSTGNARHRAAPSTGRATLREDFADLPRVKVAICMTQAPLDVSGAVAL